MSNNKLRYIIGGIAVVVLVVGAIAFTAKSPVTPVVPSGQTQTSDTTSTGTSTTDGTQQTTTTGGYTLAQVATHNSAASCWTTINGNVYDLTQWIGQHPGGEGAILSICGIDGTSAFEGQHGDQGRPNAMLATFKIGVLLK